MNYRQTLDYLYAQLPMFQRIGAAAYKADLSNTIALCDILGQPQNGFRSVHIAGTNGKGSTSHLIAAVLQTAGYKTGLYTSPHLKDFRERIRINGKMIPKSYVTAFVQKYQQAFRGIEPSFFEYTAVMAFQYFREEAVDIAVIETGMGGRLDSTNVITPVLSVITNISKDHMAYLGNTLQAIAGEKAGIIKPGVPVLIGETQDESAEVFNRRASEQSAPIHFADQEVRLRWAERGKGTFVFVDRDGVPMHCPLQGLYQEKNLVTAFRALELMQDSGFRIQDGHIKQGFADVVKLTGLRGRWETIRKRPRVICDVGHNEAGIRYFMEQLATEKYDRLHWVLGLVNDKDAGAILSLLPAGATYYFCKANIPRGMDALELKAKAREFGLQGSVYPSVAAAYRAALGNAGKKDLVFVGGSTFVVAEVIPR